MYRFREWYITNFTGESSIARIARIQNSFPKLDKYIIKYFEFLSIFGEPPFYTFFIPVAAWSGQLYEGMLLCFMMSFTLYQTDNLKDIFGCPRPPCPPLKRGGTHSHSLEYGMPSTHSAMGFTFAWVTCRMMADNVFPDHPWLVWFVGLNFAFQTCYSRVYLGLHWIADLVSGFFVFCVSALCQHFVLERIMRHYYDHPHDAHIGFVYLLAHVLILAHAAPRDACPCYEDTVRFIGASVGAVTGTWMLLRTDSTYTVRMTPEHNANVWASMSFFFILEFFLGVILIAIGKTVVTMISQVVLKKVYVFLSGAKMESMPHAIRPLYRLLCILAGLSMGRKIYWQGMNNENVEGSKPVLDPDLKGKGEQSPASPSSSIFVQTAEGELVVDVVAAVQVAVGDDEPAIVMHPPSSTVTSPVQKARNGAGQLWSLHTHNYWWQWDIHSKFLAYTTVGFIATFIAPLAQQHWLGSK